MDNHFCIKCLQKANKYEDLKLTLYAFNKMQEYITSWAKINVNIELNQRFNDMIYFNGMLVHKHCYSAVTHKTNLENAIKRYTDQKNSVKTSDEVESSTEIESSTITSLKHIAAYSMLDQREPDTMPGQRSERNYEIEICDTEMLKLVREKVIDNQKTMDMKELEVMFNDLMSQKGFHHDYNYVYISRHLKKLLQDTPEINEKIDFLNSHKKPTVIASKEYIQDVICRKHFEGNSINDEKDVVNVSKLIRKELTAFENWTFDGDFTNFVHPPTLLKLMQMITGGTVANPDMNQKRIDEISAIARTATEFLYSNFKSDRVVKYKPKLNSERGFESSRLSPLTLGSSLLSYVGNRSKQEIDHLFCLGFGISYEKLERIVTGIAMSAIKRGEENGLGIFLPPFVVKGIRPIFAADNIDFGSDRVAFHGADLMIAQRVPPSEQFEGDNLLMFTYGRDRSLPHSIQQPIEEIFIPIENDVVTFDKKMEKTVEITSASKFSTIMWLLLLFKNTVSKSYNNNEEDESYDNFSDEDVDYTGEFEIASDGYGSFSDEEELLDSENGTHEETQDCRDSQGDEDDDKHSLFESVKEKDAKNFDTPPSWSAYNSLISQNSPISFVSIVPPLFLKSPTNTYILLEILKRAQNINTMVFGEGHLTIITLDGDLYARAVRIKDYKKRWIIRLGSLHQIIAALKALGKYIEDSGLELAWEIAGIFGSATVRQIIEGRHIYRGIEAHTITLIALFELNLESLFSKKDLRSLRKRLSNIRACRDPNFQADVKRVQSSLTMSGVFEKLQSNQHKNDVTKFLHNYMNQVLNLLTFISATRNSEWQLHLASSQEMCKYFHAHDQSNYSRWVPLYIADMLELQTTDPAAWEFLNSGNFTVTKSDIPFTSIDPDHSIEQLHRDLKSKGGFIGTTHNQNLLDRYSLTVPLLSMIAEKFKSYAGIKSHRGHLHHEIIGNMFKTRLEKAKMLANILCKEGNPFLFTDLCNFVNFSVPSEDIKKNVANRDELGQKAFENFWETRLSVKRTIPFWDTLHRNNIKYFSSQSIMVVDQKSKRESTLMEERNLYARLLAVSKTRPQDLKSTIGEFEFSSYPPSNFTANGDFIKHNDKYKLFNLLNKLPKANDNNQSTPIESSSKSSIPFVIDGMRLVNEIQKTGKLNTAKDFFNEFIRRFARLTEKSSDVRLMFDEYNEKSLKNITRIKRNVLKKVPIHFHVNDSTPIRNLNQFLAHWKTKKELTKYLSDKVIEFYKGSKKKILVAYQKQFFGNYPLSEIVTLPCMLAGEHTLEEADQLILLNCADVAKRSRSKQSLTVYASDTDVLVSLISLYKIIPTYTKIQRMNGQVVCVRDLFERLGEKRAKALLGWYTFQETDQTGGFAGKGITTHFKTFMAADDDILQAFIEFGETLTVSDFVIKQVERYTCYLYARTFTQNICELRYSLSLQENKRGSQLPPTLGTLIPHLKRSFYMSLIWKTTIQPSPEVISPSDYGWYLDETGEYHPVRCDKPSAPDALLNLKHCGCKSTVGRCNTARCKCLKNKLPCTDLCKCGDQCKNRENESDKEPTLSDEDDLDNF